MAPTGNPLAPISCDITFQRRLQQPRRSILGSQPEAEDVVSAAAHVIEEVVAPDPGRPEVTALNVILNASRAEW